MFIQEANSNLWKVQLPSRSNHDPCTPLSSSFSSLYSLIMILLLLILPHHVPSPPYTPIFLLLLILPSLSSFFSLYSPHHIPSPYTPSSCSISSLYSLIMFLLLLILPSSFSFLYSLIIFLLLFILPYPLLSHINAPRSSQFYSSHSCSPSSPSSHSYSCSTFLKIFLLLPSHFWSSFKPSQLPSILHILIISHSNPWSYLP